MPFLWRGFQQEQFHLGSHYCHRVLGDYSREVLQNLPPFFGRSSLVLGYHVIFATLSNIKQNLLELTPLGHSIPAKD